MYGKVGGRERAQEPDPDLGSQLEDIFIHVFKCERWANLDDRINLSLQTWQRSQRQRRDGPLGLGHEAADS